MENAFFSQHNPDWFRDLFRQKYISDRSFDNNYYIVSVMIIIYIVTILYTQTSNLI